MKLLTVVTVLCIYSNVRATKISPCEDTNIPEPLSVEVMGCPDSCSLYFQNPLSLNITFETGKVLNSGVLNLNGRYKEKNFPYKSQDICDYFVNSACPLETGETVIFLLTEISLQELFVEKPEDIVDFTVSMQDEEGVYINCFRFKADII